MRPRVINLLTNAASSAAGLFIPLYAAELHAGVDLVGFIVAAYNAFLLFASIVFGREADIRGVRRILRAGLLLSAVASLTQAFATDPWTLVAARAFLGFCAGMYPAALLAYAKTADRLMGRFSAWGSLGWALGNIVAGVIAAIYPGVYWQVFALASGAWFLAFFLATEAPEAGLEARVRAPWFPRTVLRRNTPIYATMFIRHTGANMVWAIFPLYLAQVLRLDNLQIGVIYALNPFVQFLVMRKTDRLGASTLVRLGLVGSVATFLLFTLAPGFWSMLTLQVLLGFSWATLYVGALRHVLEDNVETATAGGWLNSVTSFAAILGPALGGVLALYSYLIPMYAAAVLSAVALALYLYQMRGARPAAPVA